MTAAPAVVVELLGHPRGKGRPRRDRLPNGAYATHSDPKTRVYEADLAHAAEQAMAGRVPFEGPLTVLIEALFPIPTSWSKRRRTGKAHRFGALPPPGRERSWREVMGINGTATLGTVEQRYRTLARRRHPDHGGSDAQMAELNRAVAAARDELRRNPSPAAELHNPST